VEVQARDANSMLSFYWRLIQLRRREPALSIGSYTPIASEGDLLSYRRQFDTARQYLILLNFGAEEATFHGGTAARHGAVAMSTLMDREGERFDGRIRLRADEGLIIEAGDT
jgi:alpha-glucosidase